MIHDLIISSIESIITRKNDNSPRNPQIKKLLLFKSNSKPTNLLNTTHKYHHVHEKSHQENFDLKLNKIPYLYQRTYENSIEQQSHQNNYENLNSKTHHDVSTEYNKIRYETVRFDDNLLLQYGYSKINSIHRSKILTKGQMTQQYHRTQSKNITTTTLNKTLNAYEYKIQIPQIKNRRIPFLKTQSNNNNTQISKLPQQYQILKSQPNITHKLIPKKILFKRQQTTPSLKKQKETDFSQIKLFLNEDHEETNHSEKKIRSLFRLKTRTHTNSQRKKIILSLQNNKFSNTITIMKPEISQKSNQCEKNRFTQYNNKNRIRITYKLPWSKIHKNSSKNLDLDISPWKSRALQELEF